MKAALTPRITGSLKVIRNDGSVEVVPMQTADDGSSWSHHQPTLRQRLLDQLLRLQTRMVS